MSKSNITLIVGIILVFLVVMFGTRFVKTIPAGHAGVATLFGEVVDQDYGSGLHFPVNPLYEWFLYDIREDTITEQAKVPSQDQLQTTIDVSVRFSINESLVSTTYQQFGSKERIVEKQLSPALRSILREAGKTIPRAEDFFLEETQAFLQDYLSTSLRADLEPKGLNIDRVLIRSIDLPPFIMRAIEAKKEREQEVEKQKAELERYRTEQQQKIAQATAEREAAEQQAEKVKVLADAQAYEIRQLNEAIAENPAYLQLRAMDALKEISKNPSSKIYFLNGDSPQPLPLMNIGDVLKTGK
ncbi:prohibitin family protein [Puniceicoccales bacterium CK1056]|uniref:Prohibitin family protein n=1 Tax=Oceanipulchritudo coccoides TaxID=2706888 RepID=A0A6B2LXR6_9BACT|nr:SPFH domain-containing protein [Oceanipulchritudo coccoides]NDV61408.1 prohibitin family protein [Oceanipulchritudo coccoides]